MNRIDRLMAILLLLQGGKRSAGEIAQHFEVSRRTIQRDIDALCEMGIPIAADLGVTGGYNLPPDYSLQPLALTLHEALLLRMALSSLSQLGETPFNRERETLLAKVQTLLPRRERAHLDLFTQTLSLDVPSRSYQTPFLEYLLECANQERWVVVDYRSEKGTSQQTLLPLHLRTSAGLWYCEAYSLERAETRVYRVDRFLDVRAAASPPQVERPPAPIRHTHPSFPEIRIHLTARGVMKLERVQHLASCLQPEAGGEGLLSLHLRPADYDWLVGVLLGLGTDAKVLAPDELRVRLQRAAQDIADHCSQL
ncbi:helix-turn-helix transcriptional regulator [Dictyobacter formicarum]|uniref:DeoR family transcriptional regulator n=1 Tax=Dictyobacter formicarum TaxID=2778368 RepID=A0ABQ3VFM2_9CHLR|nr:YafY family protein [Dictyobacter formicarum]GHO84962.1 DeoR family transcriptional regulator [Dictyobacter formicarum]